jgi:endonuclease YncB( thermonuclease family)
MLRMKGVWYACAGTCAALAIGSASLAAFGGAWIVPFTGLPSAIGAGSTLRPEDLSTTTPDTYRVMQVIDGDTVDIYKDGGNVRLRLVGMDTPEVVDPRKPVQCFGREASAEGHKLLDGQWVRLEYDEVSGTYDRYGRMLAYVFRASDQLFYNEFMIANGFAHEYDYQNQAYKYRTAFKAAQTRAQQEQFGFWSPTTCSGDTTKPASTATR